MKIYTLNLPTHHANLDSNSVAEELTPLNTTEALQCPSSHRAASQPRCSLELLFTTRCLLEKGKGAFHLALLQGHL